MATEESWTTLKIIAWTKDYLLAKGVANARLEAEWLLCSALGLDRVGLYLQYDRPLNAAELAIYRAMVARRAQREPLQHILGSQEFCGLEFEVNKDVLIPRYDTEVLVTQAALRHPEARNILDVGTGSGCVAVVLKKMLVKASITATDLSKAALDVARRNAARHGAAIEFLHGSLFAPVADRRFDMIISNPPYIPSADIESLEPEVRCYDPLSALDGGSDGLDIYRLLIPAAPNHLSRGGCFLLEIGIGQAGEVVEMFRQNANYAEPHIIPDLAGIDRVVSASLKE